MKILVIYNSKTGLTKKYSQWVSDEIDCKVVSFKNAKTMDISAFNTVLFASYFYCGKISKLNWLKNQNIKNKIVLVTGASPANSPEVKPAISANFTGEKYEVFYVQSGLNYDKMGVFDKFLMSFRIKFVKKTLGENSEEYKGISSSFDNCSKDALKPLISYIKNSLSTT